jgi:antitoxin component of RelBE/YafQ-DinJ toxin-antitoxin module
MAKQPQPEQSIEEPLFENVKSIVLQVRVDSTTWREAEQIKNALGITDSEFVRFCIVNCVLFVKSAQLRLHLSKEYADKIFKEDAIETFAQLRANMIEQELPHVELK